MKTKTVKRIFLFFLIYLPVQYAVVGIVGYYNTEPWPAFTFPGFKNVYVYGDVYTVNHYFLEIEVPGRQSVRTYSPNEFFPEVPNSIVAGFLRANLSERAIENYDTETKNWFLSRAEELTGFKNPIIFYKHERSYFSRDEDQLRRDSVWVMSRINIAGVDENE